MPIERDVRYTVMGGKKSIKQGGLGKTLNMSSGGVLFTIEYALLEKQRVEVAVNWPAKLNGEVALQLVAVGSVVRASETQAAIAIERYEFKTCTSGAFNEDKAAKASRGADA